MHSKPTVLIVEDHRLLKIGLQAALENAGCCTMVGDADDGETAVQQTLKLHPDIILMDIGLPGMDGIEATWKIKHELPRTRIIMFTSRVEADVVSAAFGAGADGYCVKNAPVEQIIFALETVACGDTYLDPVIADVVVRSQNSSTSLSIGLSEVEEQILVHIRDELNNQQIASLLKMSPDSVPRVVHDLISRFVDSKSVGLQREKKERGKLNQWLTAFAENVDEETIFNEKYLIESLIGTGGVGAVYKARHLYIDRTVAIKVLHPELTDDPLLMRGFQREGTAVANLHHKNIVNVYDFGLSEDRQPFLVMEYVDGTSMYEIIAEKKRFDPLHALQLFTQVCEGLAAAHEHGIVHCDLKPSNILIAGTHGNEVVKLVDFGLVQILPRKSLGQLQVTEKYIVSGTPNYMSPEQCLGKPMDGRSDIYSLGCVLFEALTGEPVFNATTAMAIFSKHLYAEAPTLRSVCPQGVFCNELELLVASMLSKDLDERPLNMNEVKASMLHCALALRDTIECLEESMRNATR
jgi:DNA-binding NarL/FixJ family response regulator/tRNA A-37 threonylcarbamoyl transferase component Bud32